MRHIIWSLICIAACAPADVGVATSSALSGPWAPPVAGWTWRIPFNIVNPSVPGNSTCFNKPLNQLVHTAEDWGNPAGTPVRAIGAGTVLYNGAGINYPGAVIVIRHDLAPSESAALGIAASTIYSQYGHLTGVLVAVNAQVAAGQQIASVLDQGSNSHLHWEVRTVAVPQLCGFNFAGPGYTDAGTNAQNWGYMSPSGSVSALASATPATCDNNVAVGNTACNPADPGAQFVCTSPGLPSSQQWTRQVCPTGQSCVGTHCQPSGGGSCSCSGGATFWGTPVPATATSCGFQVCGGDNQRYTCQSDGWHAAGNSPCNCRCANGADSQGRAINPDYTFCGYTVCGSDHQHYACTAGGWSAQHDTCN
jgi:hypothetical protein